MTNRIAFWLGLLIVLAIGIDLIFHGTENMVFLGRKFWEFLEWLKFWR